MPTTYDGGATLARVVWAQVVLDAHVTASATSRCLDCGQPGPCREREAAAAAFFHASTLPKRRPGAIRPHLVGARRVV